MKPKPPASKPPVAVSRLRRLAPAEAERLRAELLDPAIPMRAISRRLGYASSSAKALASAARAAGFAIAPRQAICLTSRLAATRGEDRRRLVEELADPCLPLRPIAERLGYAGDAAVINLLKAAATAGLAVAPRTPAAPKPRPQARAAAAASVSARRLSPLIDRAIHGRCAQMVTDLRRAGDVVVRGAHPVHGEGWWINGRFFDEGTMSARHARLSPARPFPSPSPPRSTPEVSTAHPR